MECVVCHQSLSALPVTVVAGRLTHNDVCAPTLRQQLAEEEQKENGVKSMTTWDTKWERDEYGWFHGESCVDCPECSMDKLTELLDEQILEEEEIEFDGR